MRDEEHPDAIVLRRNGSNGDGRVLVETTLGRLLFNEAFPPDFPFHDAPVKKRDLTELASKLVENHPRAVVAESLDKLKDLGFDYATRSGLTISIADVKTPDEQGRRSSRSSRARPRRSRVSTTAASSPTTSVARRRSRSGARPPHASVTRCRRRCAARSSTPST